jgi:hypothetical protein
MTSSLVNSERIAYYWTKISYPDIHGGFAQRVLLPHWKVAQIILILKPGKSNELTSYWPICLLPSASKVFEKLLPVVEKNGLIPKHHFGFTHSQHSLQ